MFCTGGASLARSIPEEIAAAFASGEDLLVLHQTTPFDTWHYSKLSRAVTKQGLPAIKPPGCKEWHTTRSLLAKWLAGASRVVNKMPKQESLRNLRPIAKRLAEHGL